MSLTVLRPEVVARADVCFDYHLSHVDFDASSFVSRATKDATHREYGTPQTFRFGQGDVVLRVYDKVAEIAQQSGKSWFYQLWGRSDQVWRIEFQIRGQRLKQAGIRTLDDLRTLRGDLLRELAENHTALRRPNGDSNRSRWPLHPLWAQLLRDIASMEQTGLVRSWDGRETLQWRLYRQAQSLYGSLKGLAAVLSLLDQRNDEMDLEEVIEALPGLLEEHYSAALWSADVRNRMTAHGFGQW